MAEIRSAALEEVGGMFDAAVRRAMELGVQHVVVAMAPADSGVEPGQVGTYRSQFVDSDVHYASAVVLGLLAEFASVYFGDSTPSPTLVHTVLKVLSSRALKNASPEDLAAMDKLTEDTEKCGDCPGNHKNCN